MITHIPEETVNETDAAKDDKTHGAIQFTGEAFENQETEVPQ